MFPIVAVEVANCFVFFVVEVAVVFIAAVVIIFLSDVVDIENPIVTIFKLIKLQFFFNNF